LWLLGVERLAARVSKIGKGANSDWLRHWGDATDAAHSVVVSFIGRQAGKDIAGIVQNYDAREDRMSFDAYMDKLLWWRFLDKLKQRRNIDKKLAENSAAGAAMAAMYPENVGVAMADGEEKDGEKRYELQEDARDLEDFRLWFQELCERAKLSEQETCIFLLHHQGYSRKEGAERLGISENSYKSGLEYLKEKVKQAMDYVVLDLRIGGRTLPSRPICATPFEIGRNPQGMGNCWVHDPSISGRHLILEKSGNGLFTVQNKGFGKSGTYRDGKELPPSFTLDPRKEEWIVLGNNIAQIRLRLDKGWSEQKHAPNRDGPGPRAREGTIPAPQRR
jgi:DNA-directed RNA polymerase specialized sigma24 family protein